MEENTSRDCQSGYHGSLTESLISNKVCPFCGRNYEMEDFKEICKYFEINYIDVDINNFIGAKTNKL